MFRWSSVVMRGESACSPPTELPSSKLRRLTAIAVGFALIFPTFVTLIYFVVGNGHATFQAGAYGVGKGIQFAFPALFTALILGASWRVRRFSPQGMLLGVLFGGIVFFAAIVLAESVLSNESFTPVVQSLRENLRRRLGGLGFLNFWAYALLAFFYSAIHSGLEEYYWRWFVFGRLATLMPWRTAAWIGSLGFASHHVLLLGDYFGYASAFTWLGTAAVAVGGIFWCWLYRKSDSIYAPWVSHGLIDAAIYAIGARLIF